MNFLKTILAAGLLLPSASLAASVTTVMIGDNDCFGRNEAVCGAGTVITAPTASFVGVNIQPFPTDDRSDAGDPAGTDVFGENGPLTFSFNFDTGGKNVTDVSVAGKVWGLDLFATGPAGGGTFGDAFEGARFQLNGVDIGTYFAAPGDGPNTVELPSFTADAALLVNGANSVSILPEDDFLQFANASFTGLDAFAVDFLTVSATLEDPTPTPVIPLPAGLPLLVGALGVLGLARRRRS